MVCLSGDHDGLNPVALASDFEESRHPQSRIIGSRGSGVALSI